MSDLTNRWASLAEEASARAQNLSEWFNPGLEDIPVQTLKDRYCDEQSKFVEVDGLNVHYQDLGPADSDKAPLLLIHGLMSSLHCWEGWVPHLSADRRVVALDVPPFAITGPYPKGRLDETTYMALLLEFADKVGLESFIPVGNSLGGFLAWRLAVEVPDRVQAVGLLDPAGGTAKMPLAIQAFKVPLVGQAYQSLTPKAAILAAQLSMFGDPKRIDVSALDRIHDLIMREGTRTAVQDNLRLLESPDPSMLSAIECPVFLQWGEDDSLLTMRENMIGFTSRVRDLRVRTYPGVGHMPMEEIPAQSLSDFDWFLHNLGI